MNAVDKVSVQMFVMSLCLGGRSPGGIRQSSCLCVCVCVCVCVCLSVCMYVFHAHSLQWLKTKG